MARVVLGRAVVRAIAESEIEIDVVVEDSLVAARETAGLDTRPVFADMDEIVRIPVLDLASGDVTYLEDDDDPEDDIATRVMRRPESLALRARPPSRIRRRTFHAREAARTRSHAQRPTRGKNARAALAVCALVAGLAGGLAFMRSPAGRALEVGSTLGSVWDDVTAFAGDGHPEPPRRARGR